MKIIDDNKPHIAVELSPEQLQCLYTALQIVQSFSSATQLELIERLSEQWPHIDDAVMTRYVDDCIDSIHRGYRTYETNS